MNNYKIKNLLFKSKHLLGVIFLMFIFLVPIQASAASAPPPPNPSNCSETNGCDLITVYVQPALDLLSGLVGVVVVISLILGGMEYSAAEGDPQKSAKAKNRIAKTIMALIAYFFVYAFLQFLVPNGIFH